MATKKSNKKDPEVQIENALDKTEGFLQKYTKQLLIALIIAVVIVGGYFAYVYLVTQPREKKAAEAMFVAEQIFATEDYRTALEGDGNNAGFMDVADEYKSTKQGRLAAHYAGVCCMKLGEMDQAMDYLKRFKPVKGAPGVIITAQNYGCQGDVYVGRQDYKKAEEMYRKAIDAADNVLTTPYYLKKLALVHEQTGDIAGAVKACERIQAQYASSIEARDIDKYIGYLQQK